MQGTTANWHARRPLIDFLTSDTHPKWWLETCALIGMHAVAFISYGIWVPILGEHILE